MKPECPVLKTVRGPVCLRFKRLALVWLFGVPPLVAHPIDRSSTQALLRQIGVTKGICALPGDVGCKLALTLAGASDLVLYVQLADAPPRSKLRDATRMTRGFTAPAFWSSRGRWTICTWPTTSRTP
jgi:hypothetical protein